MSEQPVNRPVFLTVLCFLTFMSSVSGLWSQSESLWNPGITADRNKEMYEEVRKNVPPQATEANTKMMDDIFQAVITQTSPKTIAIGNIIMLIFESFSIYAAYLMWNFQKKGYYLYLCGIAVAFLAPIFLIGSWLGAITAVSGIFVSVFMAIMYAFNLKYLS